MSARWSFSLHCPKCDTDDVRLVSSGRFSSREVSAVIRCAVCKSEWSLRVDIVPVRHFVTTPGDEERRTVAECGTDSGYRRHRRLGEEPCAPCRAGHAEKNKATARGQVFV